MSADSHPGVRVRDLVVRAVRFRDERDRRPAPYEGPVAGLIGRHRARSRKRGTPAFSMAAYEDGASRGNRGVLEVTAVVLDFDHLDSGIAEDVQRRLEGRAHLAYTSYSHLSKGLDDACFRVVLFCTRSMSPGEYARVWKWIDEQLGGRADRQAVDPARIWYQPTCPSSRIERARYHVGDGALLDVDAILSEATGERPADEVQHQEGLGTTKPGEDRDTFAKGERNAQLASLAGTMRKRGMGREAILAALRVENAQRCQPPLDEKELGAIAGSVSRYEPESPLTTANLTDLGNAERLAAHQGEELRYVHKMGVWLHWDGRRWARDDSGETVRRVKATVRATSQAARKLRDGKRREQVLRHALRSESSGRIKAMLELAQAFLTLPHAALDRKDWLLNCANGTIDLRNGRLLPHRRQDHLTRVSSVAYDPDADCPTWEAFLDRVMGGDPELVAFLQRAVGYTLTGSTREQLLFLLYGVGANGKSTFVEIVRLLVGEYAAQAEFSTFMKQDGAAVRNDVARLVGARFVAAVEAEGGRPLAEAMVKQMTGGDVVTARFLFREYFEFRPAFKVWLAANHKPVIKGTDHGIWRRIRLVPFVVTIPEDERDPDLVEKLKAELSGVLAWAVRGCLAWQAQGLGVPRAVREATEGYRGEMDVLGGFLADRCDVEPGAMARTKELYESYRRWAEESGERPITKKAMGMRLAERGFAPAKGTRGARCWQGLRLREQPGPEAS